MVMTKLQVRFARQAVLAEFMALLPCKSAKKVESNNKYFQMTLLSLLFSSARCSVFKATNGHVVLHIFAFCYCFEVNNLQGNQPKAKVVLITRLNQ